MTELINTNTELIRAKTEMVNKSATPIIENVFITRSRFLGDGDRRRDQHKVRVN